MSGGKTLYQGEMLESLEAKIDAVMLKLDGQIASMETQVTALNAINTSVAQSISAVNVAPSDNSKWVLPARVTKTAVADTYVAVARLVLLMNGKCRLGMQFGARRSTGTVSRTATLKYNINGGADVVVGTVNLGTGTTIVLSSIFSADISCNFGDVIVFSVMSSNADIVEVNMIETTTKVSYDLLDIVSSGAVAY